MNYAEIQLIKQLNYDESFNFQLFFGLRMMAEGHYITAHLQLIRSIPLRDRTH